MTRRFGQSVRAQAETSFGAGVGQVASGDDALVAVAGVIRCGAVEWRWELHRRSRHWSGDETTTTLSQEPYPRCCSCPSQAKLGPGGGPHLKRHPRPFVQRRAGSARMDRPVPVCTVQDCGSGGMPHLLKEQKWHQCA